MHSLSPEIRKDEPSEAFLLDHYAHLRTFSKDFRNANLFRLVTSYVTGKTVVDIGCGAGFFASGLIHTCDQVIGIEPNEGLRKLASEMHPKLQVVAGKAEDIDTLFTEPVDTITMLDVLEHIEDDALQVKKVSEALVPGGRFVIVVPAHPSLYGIRDERAGHFRRYTKDGLRALLEGNGFTVERMRYWNALGVVPYAVSEKILKRPLQVRLREEATLTPVKTLAHKVIDGWMREVENRLSFGFGLSLICIARKH